MKKTRPEEALLTPDADGWCLRLGGKPPQPAKTLEEAAASLPADVRIHLALPGRVVLLERLTLPSTDRSELAGMVQLQLEKTLPYPIEEVSSDFDVISQSETESTLVSVATNTSALNRLCEPLRNRARLPHKITLYAMHVAASCPPDEVVLCVWPEEGQLELAICENGKLGYAQTLPATDADSVLTELTAILLSAEMEGVPTDFARIRVEQGCAHLRGPLEEHFGRPVELMSFDAPLPEPSSNLVPPAWYAEAERHEKTERIKGTLRIVAVVYLLLIAGAFVYLALLKSRVQKLDRQIAETQPKIQEVQNRQAIWQTLAPAHDKTLFAIELLRVVQENRPSKEVKVTSFTYTVQPPPTQFRVEGEAPTANLAIEYVDKLKADQSLVGFRIDSPPPSFDAKTGIVRFNIFGKL